MISGFRTFWRQLVEETHEGYKMGFQVYSQSSGSSVQRVMAEIRDNNTPSDSLFF